MNHLCHKIGLVLVDKRPYPRRQYLHKDNGALFVSEILITSRHHGWRKVYGNSFEVSYKEVKC
jgi:hypothetical protein